MNNLKDVYLSSGEAAKILGIHPLSIQRLIRDEKLPAEKIAYRWLIDRDVLAEFAKSYVPKVGKPRQKRKYTKRSERWFRK